MSPPPPAPRNDRSAAYNGLREAVLSWYRACGRDLPWRQTPDAYHILVAEMMLQQTQVERVLPKYGEFLEAYPTVEDLARAPRAEVIRRWAPLGYNLRALRLQDAAKRIVEEREGRFPENVRELRSLKGVGAYTAGALACFAFGQPVPFLDTNIRRVLGRALAGIPFPAPADDRELLSIAAAAMPSEAPGPWHQALMDVGATVCRRSRPACSECPVRPWCLSTNTFDGSRPAAGVAEARSSYRGEPAYEGSRRYYRGRIVAALRDVPAGGRMTVEELEGELGPGARDGGNPVEALLEALERDGLVAVERGGDEPGGWRVSLP